MKILLIGSGAREHAIAYKLSLSQKVEKIFVAPGNGGTYLENKCRNIGIKNHYELLDFAKNNSIDFTFVGPEQPLADGIVDLFESNGLKIIGPDKFSSQLESSKSFAKKFMNKYNVQTANYKEFSKKNNIDEITNLINYPAVIKADGLAAGKGVFISENKENAKKVLKDLFEKEILGKASEKIIIEDAIPDFECSVFTFFDGENAKTFAYSQDHKKLYEGEKGPNTGGMGSITPHPLITEKQKENIINKIINPTIKGIKKEKMNYKGVIFFGVKFKKDEPYLLEYNVRFGDPETQSIMYILETDLVEIFESILNKSLNKIEIKLENKISQCVVVAAKGYPKKYNKNIELNLDNFNSKIFHAGTKIEKNKLLSCGGRIFSIVEKAETLSKTREKIYSQLKSLKKPELYYRKDI
jgi:phosphoribosylamine--glycine ligase